MRKKPLIRKKIEKFNSSGFIVLKKLLNQKEINSYKNEIEKLSKILVKKYKAPYVNLTKDKKLNTAHHLNKIFPKSKLMKIQNKIILKKFIEKIFNRKLIMKNLEVFAKPAKSGMRAPFHQDNFYWNIKNKMAINTWIAIDKANINNGGLIYLEGSHKKGLFEHLNSKVPGTSKEIKSNVLAKLKLKRISPTLYPGDCLIHHCEIVHGSKKNNSNLSRRGIALRFVAKNAQVDKLKMKKYLTDLKNI